jgi:hypothetical protein
MLHFVTRHTTHGLFYIFQDKCLKDWLCMLQDLETSRRLISIPRSSEMSSVVHGYKLLGETCCLSIQLDYFYTDNGGSMFLRNVGNCVPVYTALYRTKSLVHIFVVAHPLYSSFTPAPITRKSGDLGFNSRFPVPELSCFISILKCENIIGVLRHC